MGSRRHGGMHGAVVLLAAAMVSAIAPMTREGFSALPAGENAPDAARVTVELIDSVRCWCSPLWGHNAPKIVAGKGGEFFVALFSGEYPEARVEILKRFPDGRWERGKSFSGAYQPSVLFMDDAGRLNLIQNSQTEPILHLRSADDTNLRDYDTVARGNGQADGRGWYIGAAIEKNTVYMSYVTLTYDLFLTWKALDAAEWAVPVLLHAGTVDALKGNHSWTRPRIQFHGRRGFLVVNETSDGSVKNSYNAVQLVTFDLDNPRRFTTDCVDRVPQGFGAYSSDFQVTPDGWLHCLVNRSGRLYETPLSWDGIPGVFIASRRSSATQWSVRQLWNGVGDAALAGGIPDGVMALGISAGDVGQGALRAAQFDGRTGTWSDVRVSGAGTAFMNPTHIQMVTSANGWKPDTPTGLFEDVWGRDPGKTISRYGVYFLTLGRESPGTRKGGNW